MLLARFGARHVASLRHDGDAGELERIGDPGDGPDAAYDREFARTVVAAVLVKLRVEAGDGVDALWPFLFERGESGEMRKLAAGLGVSGNTLSQRLRRLRLRLRELLREEFATLVADPSSIDEELRSLRSVLMRE
jgi:hypothetical protein